MDRQERRFRQEADVLPDRMNGKGVQILDRSRIRVDTFASHVLRFSLNLAMILAGTTGGPEFDAQEVKLGVRLSLNPRR